MAHAVKAIALLATLALAACNNPDRYGAGGPGGLRGVEPQVGRGAADLHRGLRPRLALLAHKFVDQLRKQKS